MAHAPRDLSSYENSYPTIAFKREDGVLQMTLHRDGGPYVLSEEGLVDLGFAFNDVAADIENKVVILTGTGDRFCTDFDYGSFIDKMEPDIYAYWLKTRTDGRRFLDAFLNIEVPVISAINGPVVTHSELPLLADVVLASESTVFQDATHFIAGMPPGDGMHTVWTTLLGLNRGRHFLLTGRIINAQEALDLGVVSEVLEQDELLARAWELARTWAALPLPTLYGTRSILAHEWRRLITSQLYAALTDEALAGTSLGAFPMPEERVVSLYNPS